MNKKFSKIILPALVVGTLLSSNVSAFAQDSKNVTVQKQQAKKEYLASVSFMARSMTAEITGDNVRLRQKPGLNGKIIRTLAKGTYVTVSHGAGEVQADGYSWVMVTIQGTNISGYVATKYISEIG